MKFVFSLLLTFLAFCSSGQYVRPNAAYGTVTYRSKADSVVHLPALNDTLLHTTDTSSQIRVFQGDLYYRYKYWRKANGSGSGGLSGIPTLQQITDSAGGTSVTSGSLIINALTASGNINCDQNIYAANFYGNGSHLTGVIPDTLLYPTWFRLYKAIDSIGSLVTYTASAPVNISGNVINVDTSTTGTGVATKGFSTNLYNINAANISSNTSAIGLKLNTSDSTIYSTKANYKKGADSLGALIAANTSSISSNTASIALKKNISDSVHTVASDYVRQDRLKNVVDSAIGTVSTNYLPLTGGTLTGTTNTGYIGFPTQTTAMSAPASGFKIYDSSGFTLLRSDGYRRVLSFTGLTANVKYNFPVGTTNDTVTTNVAPQTLTNKTISGSSNILTNIAQSSVTSLSTDLAAKFPLLGGAITGTGGSGYIGFPAQSSAPSTPATGVNLYANDLNDPYVINSSGTVSKLAIAEDARSGLIRTLRALGSPILSQTAGVHQLETNSSGLLTSQQARFMAIEPPLVSTTYTGAAFYMAATGVFTGSNTNAIALYSYSGGTLTKIAETANSESIWKNTANTMVQVPFASTVTVAANTPLYLEYLYCSSAQTTAPSLSIAPNLVNAAITGGLLTNSAKIQGLSTQTSSPSTIASSSIITTTGRFWGALY